MNKFQTPPQTRLETHDIILSKEETLDNNCGGGGVGIGWHD